MWSRLMSDCLDGWGVALTKYDYYVLLYVRTSREQEQQTDAIRIKVDNAEDGERKRPMGRSLKWEIERFTGTQNEIRSLEQLAQWRKKGDRIARPKGYVT